MLPLFTWLEKFIKKKSIVREVKLEKNLLSAAQYLLTIILLHTIAITWLETHSFGDALWLTLTTITTVGYGDIQIDSLWGRMTTVLLLYMGGIFVLAKTAADYFEYRALKLQQKLKGKWRWNMTHHIVIISDHDDHIPDLYYQRLVTEFRQASIYKNSYIQILTQNFNDGLPEPLQRLGVTHYTGKGNVPNDLEAVAIDRAKVIIVLSKQHTDPLSDGHTFDILHRLRDMNQTAVILVECVDDANRSRLQQAGANLAVRPIRAYPEMIVSALRAPGSEQVIENLFTLRDDKYQRFDVAINKMEWAEIVYRLIKADIGIVVAYVTNDGEVCCNPSGREIIDAKALIVMVRGSKYFTREEIKAILVLTDQMNHLQGTTP